MNLRRAFDFSCGVFCYFLAISMFFCFPGVEAWTFSALPSIARAPRAGIDLLLVILVVTPAMIGPLLFILRAHRHERAKLASGCFALAGLFLLAGAGAPLLLCGRVALIALLSGQLLALGFKAKESVPFNWMAYLAFLIANLNFPDAQILRAADFLAGAHLLSAGILVFKEKWKPEPKRRSRAMVG